MTTNMPFFFNLETRIKQLIRVSCPRKRQQSPVHFGTALAARCRSSCFPHVILRQLISTKNYILSSRKMRGIQFHT